ncbi:MAG: prepilin-type N-terminal cleavage/methylation domain-containing protein [Nitrospiraceae bacterium]|nr:prepilin-type N-terminal cleavage/methylation domain-containing protein [Nitrospiraceae bacterium]
MKSKGFTLIELAVVIVVLGLMVSFVIPTFGELTGANLRRSARHLTGTIRYLRDEAEAKKEVVRLRFDIQNGRYWPEIMVVNEDRTVEFKRLSSEVAGEAGLSGNTTFRDLRVGSHPDDPYILFTPDGWVEKAFIHLRDGEGKDFTLVVRPLTGDTDLLEGDVEEK